MKNLNKTNNALDSLLQEIKDFVKENGGFINTTNLNNENDQMYAYVYFWGDDTLEELKVIAVKVENDVVYVALSSLSISIEINGADDFNEDDWYSVGTNGDVLTAQTILSIAESIEQYV